MEGNFELEEGKELTVGEAHMIHPTKQASIVVSISLNMPVDSLNREGGRYRDLEKSHPMNRAAML